jgi:DNA/RNA endonuclease YhcR with UshA esterase domain
LEPGSYAYFDDLNLSLNNSGDTIGLFTKEEDLLHQVSYSDSEKSKSLGLKWVESYYSEEFSTTKYPTPGEQNVHEIIEFFPIIEARKESVGSKVGIEGYVTVETDVLGNSVFYVQDDTSGIRVDLASKLEYEAKPGQLVRIIGEVDESRNELEIDVNELESIVLTNDSDIRTFSDISENWELHEGKLTHLEGEIVKNYSTSFDIQTRFGIIRVSVLSSTQIDIPEKSKGDYVKVTGIISQYDDLYRILPRYQNDIQILPKPKAVKPSSSSKSSTKTPVVSSAIGTSGGEVLGTVDYKLPANQIFNLDPVQNIQKSRVDVYVWPIFVVGLVVYFWYVNREFEVNQKFQNFLQQYKVFKAGVVGSGRVVKAGSSF